MTRSWLRESPPDYTKNSQYFQNLRDLFSRVTLVLHWSRFYGRVRAANVKPKRKAAKKCILPKSLYLLSTLETGNVVGMFCCRLIDHRRILATSNAATDGLLWFRLNFYHHVFSKRWCREVLWRNKRPLILQFFVAFQECMPVDPVPSSSMEHCLYPTGLL